MPASKFHRVRDDIVRLHAEGWEPSRIMRELGLASSTFYDYLGKLKEAGELAPKGYTYADEAPDTWGDDHLVLASLENEASKKQFEAVAAFQKASSDELMDAMGRVVEGVQQLKVEGDVQSEALQASLGGLKVDTALVEDIRANLTANQERIDRLAHKLFTPALRWIWLKALLVSGSVFAVGYELALRPAVMAMVGTLMAD